MIVGGLPVGVDTISVSVAVGGSWRRMVAVGEGSSKGVVGVAKTLVSVGN